MLESETDVEECPEEWKAAERIGCCDKFEVWVYKFIIWWDKLSCYSSLFSNVSKIKTIQKI